MPVCGYYIGFLGCHWLPCTIHHRLIRLSPFRTQFSTHTYSLTPTHTVSVKGKRETERQRVSERELSRTFALLFALSLIRETILFAVSLYLSLQATDALCILIKPHQASCVSLLSLAFFARLPFTSHHPWRLSFLLSLSFFASFCSLSSNVSHPPCK